MKSIQYTLRKVPERMDAVLRRKARESGQSLNSVILDMLMHETNLQGEMKQFNDLDFIAGSWKEDADFDAALQSFNTVDESLWR